MDKYEMLFIRACKKQHVSKYALKRIASIRAGISLEYIHESDVISLLVGIVEKYKLTTLEKFHTKFMEFVTWYNFPNQIEKKVPPATEIFLDTVISTIRFSDGTKFSGCIWPLRFRIKK